MFFGLCYHNKAFGGLAQLVRASASHAEGRRFESAALHHTWKIRTLSRQGQGSDFLFPSVTGYALRLHGKHEIVPQDYFVAFPVKML